MNTTDILAWWGAIVGTFVLVWDVIKWRKEGVQIALKIEENSIRNGIRFEIINRGGKPTTIKELNLFTYHDKPFLKFFGLPKFTQKVFPKGEKDKAPIHLQPGKIWAYDLYYADKQDPIDADVDYKKLLETNKLYYELICSHQDRPICGMVAPFGIHTRIGRLTA